MPNYFLFNAKAMSLRSLVLSIVISSVLVLKAFPQLPVQAGVLSPEQLLKDYQSIPQAEVLVLGTFHFDKEILSPDNQLALQTLTTALAQFQPTKIVVEWHPSKTQSTNEQYQQFLKGNFDIKERPNEVYQLGFRLAHQLEHDQIYLFDNRPAFIGTLEGFSFDKLFDYPSKADSLFGEQHYKIIHEAWTHNDSIYQSLPLYQRILLMNSTEASLNNIHRMHALETRIGIQDSWIGPDWLGRWYQRNIRMLCNVLKFSEAEDRILIIVGSNHKWILEQLINNFPDYKLISSWDYLKK